MIKLSLTSAFFLLVILQSCVSETDNPTPSLTTYVAGESANGKDWRVTRIEVDGIGSLTPFSCTLDNIYRFYRSGRHEMSEVIEKCDPNDPPAYTGTWSFNAPQDQLTIALGDSVRNWRVKFLGERDMHLTSRFGTDDRTYIFENN